MSDLKPFEFVEDHAPYHIGDIAGFNKEDGEKLVDLGVAVEYGKAKTAKAVKAPAKNKMIKGAPEAKSEGSEEGSEGTGEGEGDNEPQA